MINWLFEFFGWCRKHKVRLEWDGACPCYICPECAQTPEYRANIEEYLRTH